MPETPSQTEQPSSGKERQILDGAAMVFAVNGYKGASMSRIAGEAGVSKGTLYHYYADKKQLFMAFVRRECADRIAAVFENIDADGPLEESLLCLGRRMLDMLLSEPGLVMYRTVIAEAPRFPELAAAFHEAGPEKAKLLMAAWIKRTVEAGRLRAPDPEFAAEQLFALMQAKLCMLRRLGMIGAPGRPEIDQIVEGAVRLFMRGCAI